MNVNSNHLLTVKERQHILHHLHKPRVLNPLRSCVRNEVELVSLACEDGVRKERSGVSILGLRRWGA